MDTVKSKIKIADNLIYPETSADMVKYSDTTLKDAFDNYTPFEMSDFGKGLSRSSSLAELCRKMHINYFFAKDLIDNVVWNIVGAPETENQKLHATNNNYIWRAFTLGAYSSVCEFDLTCADPNKVIFQFFDNVAWVQTAAVTRHWVRLATDSDGQLCFRYIYQSKNNGNVAWNSAVTAQDIPVGYANTQKHINLTYIASNPGEWRIFFNNSTSYQTFNYTMATRSWRVYLGYTADCTIDNFSLYYNGDKISELDFD